MTKAAWSGSTAFMNRIFRLLIAISAIALVLAFSRVSQADDDATLSGNHPVEAESFRQLGAPNPDLPLRMRIQFKLRNRKGLESLLKEQQNPASPNYHKWLTSEEFVKRFGPTNAQVKAVARWLTGEGFTLSRQSSDSIEFTGPVRQTEQTFRLRIAKFGDGSVFANTTDPIIPRRFEAVIGGISGMDNMLHAVALGHRIQPATNVRPPVAMGL